MTEKQAIPKLNNKGVSLIELLVAITIISVIAIAFYNGFIIAAKTNAKSKIQHKATTLAQNIVEGLKAEDMDSIMQQFEYPTYTVADEEGNVSSYTNFRILPASITGTGYGNVGTFASEPDYAVSSDGGKTAFYQPTADGKYYLYLRNLKMEKTFFDALITIDGSAYMQAPGGAVGSGGQMYNENEVVQIPSMDANYDGIVSNSSEYDTEAISKLQLKDNTLTKADVERTITINVTDEELLSGNRRQKVTAEYQYLDYLDAENKYVQTDTVFYNDEDLTKQLRNVFVFFQPAHDWKSDTIIVNNSSGRMFELYLIKQQTEENIEAFLWEDSYYADIRITEPISASALSNVKIRTNLGYSLKDGEELIVNKLQAHYFYNGMLRNESEVKTFFDLGTLTNKRKTDKLMNITVDVYTYKSDAPVTSREEFLADRDTGDRKATMQGTIRN